MFLLWLLTHTASGLILPLSWNSQNALAGPSVLLSHLKWLLHPKLPFSTGFIPKTHGAHQSSGMRCHLFTAIHANIQKKSALGHLMFICVSISLFVPMSNWSELNVEGCLQGTRKFAILVFSQILPSRLVANSTGSTVPFYPRVHLLTSLCYFFAYLVLLLWTRLQNGWNAH